MLKKDIAKKISIILAAAMLASCGGAAFADTTPVVQTEPGDTTETPGDGTTTDGDDESGAGAEPGGDSDSEQGSDTTPVMQELNANISANYTHNDSLYTVVFTTLTELDSMKDFDFTISVSGEAATIDRAAFSDALATGKNFGVSTTTGNTVAAFVNGSETTPLSGKVVLCSLTIESSTAPTAETITISDFTAVDKDGKTVKIIPALTVTDEPIVPELSKEEQDVYDMITALPSAESFSFYTDEDKKKLTDTEELSKTISEALEAYKALDADEKSNVDETLAFYNKSADGLDALAKLAADMDTVSDVLVLAQQINAIEEASLLDYRFLPSVYSDVIAKEIKEDELSFPAEAAVSEQYNQAKADITAAKASMDEAYAAIESTDIGYDKKINLLDSQFDIIQTLSEDTYYQNYLDNLTVQAEALKEELADYPVESIKKTFIEDIDECIDKIEIIKDGIKTLPTVNFPAKINRNYKYEITLERKKDAAIEADVTIIVYEEGEKQDELDSKTVTFEEGETELSVKITALTSKYPGDANVDVYVYYNVSGAKFLIDSKTLLCKVMPSAPASGIQSGGSGSSGSSGISGGTKFPTADDNDDNDRKDDEEENILFTDIDKYDWAKEAIEGLYYAGIINGMEEGIFNPAGNVTREQFCKMVVQLFGVLENETETDFVDVDSNAWYAPYICSSIRAGYVQGQSDEYFGIGESIMRQDMATILYRALGEQNSRAVLDFTDNDDIAEYAEDAISELVGLGIINGYEDGSFKPRGTATRAEAAKVIWGVYNLLD